MGSPAAGRNTQRPARMRAREAGPGRAGPGGALFERGAITRTFDTPGFRGMTFYEIQAKSIVNRVPATSRMAFSWTINPYRGCQHACFLLRRRRNAHPDGGRPHQTPGRHPRRRRDLRHRPQRLLPAVRDHDGPRALVHDQARLPDHAGGRDPADRQRRPPLPHRAGLEARDRRGAWPAAAAVPDRQQQADGDRRVRGSSPRTPSTTGAATCAAWFAAMATCAVTATHGGKLTSSASRWWTRRD